jgi:hypothetical protein
MEDTERYLFLALLEAVEDIEMLFHSIAHRHTALLISLRNNGVLTAAQYEETLKERQAAGAVDLALNPEWVRKKNVLAELKQALERGHWATPVGSCPKIGARKPHELAPPPRRLPSEFPMTEALWILWACRTISMPQSASSTARCSRCRCGAWYSPSGTC